MVGLREPLGTVEERSSMVEAVVSGLNQAVMDRVSC